MVLPCVLACPQIYFKGGCLELALRDLKGKKRAFIVTDKPLFDMGYADKVTHILDGINVHHQIFYHVSPDPTLACIEAGLKEINEFKPDVIIAMGGGSPMDAAKVRGLRCSCVGSCVPSPAQPCTFPPCFRHAVLVSSRCKARSQGSWYGSVSPRPAQRCTCPPPPAPSSLPPQIMWLMYEVPDTRFEGLAMRFMDIRKRVYEVPELGAKATMVCIPTTSGTGSEVTPFSVVTDEGAGAKYPLAGERERVAPPVLLGCSFGAYGACVCAA